MPKLKRISNSEAEEIKRYLLPLPHELSVCHKVVLSPGDIGITLKTTAGETARNAVASLKQLFKDKAGVDATGDNFKILVGIIDDDGGLDGITRENTERMRQAPNNEQAYLIQPVQENSLVVGGLSEKGLRYGIMTLLQLIEPLISRDAVSIPLVSVLDWPDFDDRACWQMPLKDLPWLASMKFNQFNCNTYFKVLPDRKVEPQMTTHIQDDPAAEVAWSMPFDKARSLGVDVVPGIIHMDFWERRCAGFASTYPELIGKGESAKGGFFDTKGFRVPCASNPRLVEVLIELMTAIAAWGVSDVCVWMSEYPGQCECEKCVNQGQFQAEAHSTLKAWQHVRRKYPDLKLRIFFGAGGFRPGDKWVSEYPQEAIDEILATLPKEVRLCVSLGIKEDALERHADQGGLVTACFIVSLSFWDFFRGENIKKRMKELRAKKVRGINQYFEDCVGDVRGTLDFQLSALAEYSWNTNGRSIKEFAESWATRHGYKNPEHFGEWISLLSGTVGESSSMDNFIFSGSWLKELSDVLAGQNTTATDADGVQLPEMTIEECRLALEWSKFFEPKQLPLLSETLVRSVAFQGTNSIDDSISDCRKAVELARRFESREPLLHSEVLLRYCELEKAGRDVMESCRAGENNDVSQSAINSFREAMEQFIEALQRQSAGLTVSPPAELLRKQCITNLKNRYRDVLHA